MGVCARVRERKAIDVRPFGRQAGRDSETNTFPSPIILLCVRRVQYNVCTLTSLNVYIHGGIFYKLAEAVDRTGIDKTRPKGYKFAFDLGACRTKAKRTFCVHLQSAWHMPIHGCCRRVYAHSEWVIYYWPTHART